MRPAARDAHEGEPLEPEVIGQGTGIAGRRGNPATWHPARSPVPGSVVGDPADFTVEVDVLARMMLEPASRSAVVVQDGRAFRVSDLEIGKLHPFCRRERSALRHRSIMSEALEVSSKSNLRCVRDGA
jgi:hypothetical protein